MLRRLYGVMAALSAVLLTFDGAVTAHAQPGAAETIPDPFPDIRYYDQLDAKDFVAPGGVWFTAPARQRCGIWGLGNFGCAGDIPGAPAGVSHIGWINGDRAVHYDWSMAVRFPATQPQLALPPRSKITHEGTTCAATPDGRTYCERGPLRFVIESARTWLTPPWMDLSWVVLGPASCAPPGGGPCFS